MNTINTLKNLYAVCYIKYYCLRHCQSNNASILVDNLNFCHIEKEVLIFNLVVEFLDVEIIYR